MNEIVTIYTVITNDYDTLKEPEVITPHCRYLCFTDKPRPSEHWEMREPNNFPGQGSWYAAKHIKVFPWRYVTTPLSVYVDGTAKIVGPVRAMLEESLSHADIAFFPHLNRRCAYAEGAACVRLRKDDRRVIEDQMKWYAVQKFPKNYGLICGGVIFRRHTDAIKRLMETWWHEITTHSHRDQLSFNFACWKLQERYALLPGALYGENPAFKMYPKHKGEK